jgi:hypothetical protein
MNAAEIVRIARATGVVLSAEGDSLVVEGELASAVVDQLRELKPEILELLRAERGAIVRRMNDRFRPGPAGECVHCRKDGDRFVALFCGQARAEVHAGCYGAWIAEREVEARAEIAVDQPADLLKYPSRITGRCGWNRGVVEEWSTCTAKRQSFVFAEDVHVINGAPSSQDVCSAKKVRLVGWVEHHGSGIQNNMCVRAESYVHGRPFSLLRVNDVLCVLQVQTCAYMKVSGRSLPIVDQEERGSYKRTVASQLKLTAIDKNVGSELRFAGFAPVAYQGVRSIGQAPRFKGGESGGDERQNQYAEAYPVKAVMLAACGLSLGLGGILLAVLLAPRRGDSWGYFGLLMMIGGFVLCYLAGGVRPPSLSIP